MVANIDPTAGILASRHSDTASRVRILHRPSPITFSETFPLEGPFDGGARLASSRVGPIGDGLGEHARVTPPAVRLVGS